MTRDEASKKLLHTSWIVFAVEHSFRLLQRLSPASHFRESRTTDVYIGCWFLVGVALAFAFHLLFPARPTWLVLSILLAGGIRITDIAQAAINVGVFDHLGGAKVQEVAKLLRSLALLVVNYFELWFWFGLLYLPLTLTKAGGVTDSFYFSAVTQLTVGYGDITPIGAAKGIACVQAALGWSLSLLVLARFVAFLPKIREKKSTGEN